MKELHRCIDCESDLPRPKPGRTGPLRCVRCKKLRKSDVARQSRETHPEATKERNRLYRSANRELLAAKQRARYRKDLEKSREKERIRARKFRLEKPEDRSRISRRYRLKNVDRVRATERAWAKANPERMSERSARYRARKKGSRVEVVERLVVFERDGWRCQICGRRTPASRIGTIHPAAPELDHRVPLALGGEHSYANTQCACQRCNRRKQARSCTGQLPIWSKPGRKEMA